MPCGEDYIQTGGTESFYGEEGGPQDSERVKYIAETGTGRLWDANTLTIL